MYVVKHVDDGTKQPINTSKQPINDIVRGVYVSKHVDDGKCDQSGKVHDEVKD